MQQDEQKTSNGEEKIEQITEEYNFNNPDFTFLPKGSHAYRQEGYYLVCRSCDLTHAVYIGQNNIMVGQDKDGPIIKKRKEVGMV